MKKIVRVNLDIHSYSIEIGANQLSQLPQGIKKHLKTDSIFIISNTKIAKLYRKKVDKILSSIKPVWIIIPDGEKYKNLQTIEKIHNQLSRNGAHRKSGIIAFGGGVVGDIAGFVAATFMRGISFIQVPTTLLAQVDSSVGGKTGVDLEYGKNLVGAFYQPKWVLIDPELLKTLSLRELKCGISEVIKYGAIWDEKFFSFLEKNSSKILNLDFQILTKTISRCCEIKAEVVSQDEKESGIRAILNFGHTLGHAIEQLSGFSKIKHGEAVSMGMIYAAKLSQTQLKLPEKDTNRLISLLRSFKLPIKAPEFRKTAFKKSILRDKKSTGKAVNFILLKQLGKAKIKTLDADTILSEL